MKKTGLIIFLLILGAAVVFANGNKEDDVISGEVELEKTTITGNINFTGFNGDVQLIDGETTYYLIYPDYIDTDIDLDEGESVTVEGYLLPKMEEVEDINEFVVTKAVIRGEEYDLEEEFGMFFEGGFGGPDNCWFFEEGEFPDDMDFNHDFMMKGRGGRGMRMMLIEDLKVKEDQ